MSRELKIARDLSLPLEVLTEAIGVIATRGAGKTYGSVVLIEEAYAASVQFAVIDPTGVYHGLRSSADGQRDGLPVYVIGGPHGDLPLEPSSGAFLADLVVDSGHSFVFDLSDLSKTRARSWVAAFLERLYERKARDRTTILLVVDEADEFAPQKARGESAVVLGAMEQVVKRGRSRGIGCVLISQRTQAINKDVLDLIDTLVALRVVAPRGRAAIADWIVAKEAEDEKGVVASLNSLPTGRAWLWSPVRGVLEQFTFRRIRTFDSYATPRPGETRDEPAKRKELDLDALGEQMRVTVERAKENDPAELRRRVRDLERQLTKRPEATERVEVPIEVPVEVSVLTDADRRLLKSLDGLAPSCRQAIADLEELRSLLDRAEAVASSAATPQRQRTPPRPPTRPVTPQPPPPSSHRDGDEPEEATVSRPQQQILDALAWFLAIGAPAARRSILAPMAGTSSKSSGFEKNLSTLRTAGLLDYGPGSTVYLTPSGAAAAATVDRPGTVEDLQEAVIAKVSRPQGAILRALIASYPTPLTREELADAVGASARSSGFEKNISTLKTLGVIGYPDRGYVAAHPVLFLEAA